MGKHRCSSNASCDRAAGAVVRLRCPRCEADVEELACSLCAFRMELQNGIIHALPPERNAHYARFIEEYEHIRAAEGRGSRSDDFYLALPYKDLSGRNSEQWKIRSRTYDCLIGHVLKPLLHQGALILDVGAGNCWLSFRLARQGCMPVAVDLVTNENDGLGASTHYHQHLSAPIPRFQAEAVHLPFQDEQFDAIVFNASFHYSEDYAATMREALRCLAPRGMVILCDTPWYAREESGQRMIAERRVAFRQRFGTASDSMKSLEYLTNARLRRLEEELSVYWTIHRPWYGWKWALRPWMAKLQGQREPSRFRIYVARKDASFYRSCR